MNAKPANRVTSALKKQDLFVEDDPAVEKFNKKQGKSAVSTNQSPDTRHDLKPESLAYICDMLNELRKLAIKHDEPMVSYMIEMALLEATTAQSVREFSSDLGRKSKSFW